MLKETERTDGRGVESIDLCLTRVELDATIDAVMLHRLNNDGDAEYGEMLSKLHLKLENELERWIKGYEEELPLPPHMKALGVQRWVKVHPPHERG